MLPLYTSRTSVTGFNAVDVHKLHAAAIQPAALSNIDSGAHSAGGPYLPFYRVFEWVASDSCSLGQVFSDRAACLHSIWPSD